MKRVFVEKAYAWVSVGDGVPDHFLHTTECRGFRIEDLQTGDQVEFDSTEAERGPRAAECHRV